MQPRTASREFAIILFAVLGIILLNSYAHNKYRVPSPGDIWAALVPSTEYQRMSLLQLLNAYEENAKAVQELEGVEIEGQILKERAIDPSDPNYRDAEKVGKTFRLSRRVSETGGEEGATLLSVTVNYRDPEILAPNMWIRVQGKVRPGEHEGEPVPVIDAKRVFQIDAPENPILPLYGSEMGGHDHDHDHAGHAH